MIGEPGEKIDFKTAEAGIAEGVTGGDAETGIKVGAVDTVNAVDTVSAVDAVSAGGAEKPGVIRDEGRIKISPRAKSLAEKLGIDLNFVGGTGPGGRIIERDILEMMEKGVFNLQTAVKGNVPSASVSAPEPTVTAPAPPAQDYSLKAEPNEFSQRTFDEVKLTNIRKTIAKAMFNSISTTAQLTLNASFDATEILAFRKKLKESGTGSGLEGVTLNDIILYAISRVLPKYRELNGYYLDDKMHLYHNVHLGVAVDTPRGLLVPVIPFADKKSLPEISSESKKLSQECQNGTIKLDTLKGGSFTTTNLGTLGIESFTPVLNPPQTGILGICGITQRAREKAAGSGEYVFYPAMGLSLTFDHRAIDGAPAAKFLQELRQNLDGFILLLAKG